MVLVACAKAFIGSMSASNVADNGERMIRKVFAGLSRNVYIVDLERCFLLRVIEARVVAKC